jgi:hypothetical protein
VLPRVGCSVLFGVFIFLILTGRNLPVSGCWPVAANKMNINEIIARLEEPEESVVMPDDAWNVLCEAVKRGDRKLGEGIMCFVYNLGVKECVKRIRAMDSLPSSTNSVIR